MTISTLAKRCGLSRSTLLYYESRGLLRRPPRTGGNYRAYTDHDLARVQQIGLYRKVGLSLAAVRTVLDQPGNNAAAILERRLIDIDAEVEALRGHQRAILRLLQRSRSFRRTDMITKDKWVAIMRAAGFSEADMQRWHMEFEKSAPGEHQEFLEFLHISTKEIAAIREWSRTGKGH
ncbi:MAG: MerR family transcriptional regulator [Acidobacteria bacterium]|nr:MerR family transcriptional regulator [Acidobacteriota bacterium]